MPALVLAQTQRLKAPDRITTSTNQFEHVPPVHARVDERASGATSCRTFRGRARNAVNSFRRHFAGGLHKLAMLDAPLPGTKPAIGTL